MASVGPALKHANKRKLWRTLLSVRGFIWTLVALMMAPFVWWWRKLHSKPAVATGILLTAIGAAFFGSATILRILIPKIEMIVTPFEISDSTAKTFGISGKSLTNIFVDELEAIIEQANSFSGNAYSSSTTYKPVPDSPHIPVQTSFGIEFRGISLDQLVAVWHRVRYRQYVVSGDLVSDSSDQRTLYARYVWNEDARSFKSPITDTSPDGIKAALHSAAIEMLTAREAEIPARYYLGLAVKCQGSCATDNFRKAVDLCAGWAKRDPQNPKAFFYMGYALRHSGRRPDAVLALNKAIALSPNFDLALNGKAVALTDLGHFEEAVATLKRLLDIKKAPNPENNLGVVSYDSGKFEDAVGYYKQAINLDPTYAGAYGNLGYALLHLGRNGEAVTAFNSARRLDLSNYSLLKGLAMALTRAGNPIVARNECNLASLLDPMAWQPHWIRGVVGLESHDAKVAQIEFNAALTIQPTSTVWVEIARASRLAGDQIGARSALETALKLDRYNARAHHLLGVVLSAVGDSEEAKEHFATAEKLAPSAKVDFDDDKRPL